MPPLFVRLRLKLKPLLACLLFAVPFGGVGVLTAWMTAAMLYDGARARSWVPVKADVVGDGVYRYAWEGRARESERLTLLRMGTSDLDGSDEAYARLEKARSAGRKVTVFVNPHDPTEAVVERRIPWLFVVGMTPFILGFGGVGVGGAWFAWRMVRDAIDAERPRRPASRTADKAPGSAAGALWVMAFFWNALAIPVAALVVADVLAGGSRIAFIVLIFPLVGLFLLWGALSLTWKGLRERFGGRAQAHGGTSRQ